MEFNSADYVIIAIAAGLVVALIGGAFGMWLGVLYHLHCEQRVRKLQEDCAYRAMQDREKAARGEGHELLY